MIMIRERMNRIVVITGLFLTAAVLTSALPAYVQASDRKVPSEVGGFVLGSNLNDYPAIVDTNFMRETVITDRHGFRKGVLSVGVCKYPNKILKMRLKYEDSTKKFFKKLLEEYKKVYGPPDEWKGDSFGILHIWKWHFTDKDDRKLTLQLQHNLRNKNENIGNMVKLSYPDLVEEERRCFNEMCDEQMHKLDEKQLEEMKKPDWDYMIPR